MDAPHSAPAPFTLQHTHRCPETGLFRLWLEQDDASEARVDLSVSWYADKGGAFVDHVTVDRVRPAELEAEVTRWIAAHEDDVFDACLRAS